MSAATTPIAAQPSALTPEAIDLDGLLRRLHLPTIRRPYPELEDRAEVEEMSHRDYLAVLVAEEVAHRVETRIQRATRKAPFPFLRTIEEFDFKLQTSVRLSLLGSYLGPELVTEGRSLILGVDRAVGKRLWRCRLRTGLSRTATTPGSRRRRNSSMSYLPRLAKAD